MRIKSLEDLQIRLHCSQTSFDSLTESYYEALVENERLKKHLRKASNCQALQCCVCEGYVLSLADGAYECSCGSSDEVSK
jgi:hypothetical protein